MNVKYSEGVSRMEDDQRMRMSFDITREQLSIITTEEPTSVSIKD